jgi:hypothetical protein
MYWMRSIAAWAFSRAEEFLRASLAPQAARLVSRQLSWSVDSSSLEQSNDVLHDYLSYGNVFFFL